MAANFEIDSPVGNMALHVALNAPHSLPNDERMAVSARLIANDVDYCEPWQAPSFASMNSNTEEYAQTVRNTENEESYNYKQQSCKTNR